jgi:hypothetical protein
LDWLPKNEPAERGSGRADGWLVVGLLVITSLVVAVLLGDSVAFPRG